MRIAFVVFDQLTFLDFIGFYDPVTRLKTMGFIDDLEWNTCAISAHVVDDRGLTIQADYVDQSLDPFDMLFIPGGFGTRDLQHDRTFIDWIKTAAATEYKVSVCTGSLILGAAGFLGDQRATTHPGAYNELTPYCREVMQQRIVDEGKLITAGGVASSIDAGLHVVERLAGGDARTKIARQMDYPYQVHG